MKSTENKDVYSRSSLAKALGLSLKELTQAMIEAGWLQHVDSEQAEAKWLLTSKGEFEGGFYKESAKFGRYIVWPKTVLTHPVIIELSQTQLNTTAIAKNYSVSAKIMNKLFADLGWITASGKGWTTTSAGIEQGASQLSSDSTGIPYVVWSRAILNNCTLKEHVGIYKANDDYVRTFYLFPDNKKDDTQICYQALNGLFVYNKEDLLIANFLHIHGIRYTYQRAINISTIAESERTSTNSTLTTHPILCDFFLHDKPICLLISRNQVSPDKLLQQMSREKKLQQLNYITMGLLESEIEHIETVLPKRLLDFGVSLY
ncbi:hypothetical protein ACVBE9_01520 [Eionea flava]